MNFDDEPLPFLEPCLQIAFYLKLKTFRERYMHESMRKALEKVSIAELDSQLSLFVNGGLLKELALLGLRGEFLFPVPMILRANPYLLGYYRLLFGFSQKEFYAKGPFSRFKCMESRGEIPEKIEKHIEKLCRSLDRTAGLLLLGIDSLSIQAIHELQLLTLGPQMRGSENTRLGQSAGEEFYAILEEIVRPYIKNATKKSILLENDSQRPVMIEFASDPDVRIVENMESHHRPVVSIEIKGGADVSNMHNRLGEAEKSHQKARNNGFFEFWTVLRTNVDSVMAKRESPTTSHFFHFDQIKTPGSKEYRLFRDLLGSILGIKIRR